MGAAVLFTLIILPILFSVAFVMVLIIGRMNLAASEPVDENTVEEVYVSSPAILAFEELLGYMI